MATIDRTGITPLDLAGYRALFEQRFRDAFGQDLALDDETPQAQWIGIASLVAAEIDEILVADANGSDINTAAGFQLYGLGGLFGIEPLPAARSLVTVNLTGTAGVVIPQGSQVRTAMGVTFETRVEITLTGSGDTVAMQSVDLGPIAAAAGTLTEIVTPVTGWTAVTNLSAATLGRLLETDAEFRARYNLLTTRLAAGFPSAIRARILEVEGVNRALVFDNDTNADEVRQGLTIPAHGILAVVQGGADAAVAAAIANSKTGAATGGAVLESGIRFQRVAETPVKVSVDTQLRASFTANGIADMRTALVAFAAENWEIGGAIDVRALIAPLYSVPGHVLSSEPTVTDRNDQALPALPNLNVLYTLAASDVAITTTT